MANLNVNDKQVIEELFDMQSGYVLDFSNSSFQSFVKDSVNIDIYTDTNYKEYCSKANKLRQIMSDESDFVVATLMLNLLNYCEDYFLKHNKLSEYHSKKITELKDKFNKTKSDFNQIELPTSQDDTLDTLKSDIIKSLEYNAPELVLDRLHTYSVKYLQNLCESYSISIMDDKGNKLPLHSLLGMLIKKYKTDNIIESEFSIQALKACISIFEKYNTVRNTQSYAHTNNILDKTESIFVIKIMSESLTFLDSIEKEIKRNSKKAITNNDSFIF